MLLQYRVIQRTIVLASFLIAAAGLARAEVEFASAELLQLGSDDIVVPGYSVPTIIDWNADGVDDLIVGAGGVMDPGTVEIFLNAGSNQMPLYFECDSFFAQTATGDLTVPGGACMGAFPRPVYWDGDDCKDLLIGLPDGHVMIFLNTCTDSAPLFDAGAYVQVGPAGSKTDLTVYARATPALTDWNNDGLLDLAVGGIEGKVYLFINTGTVGNPDFVSSTVVQAAGAPLVVPSYRSSPAVADLNHDGRKDLLLGNSDGQLLFYANVGTDAEPEFDTCEPVYADGEAVDLPEDPRSRPYIYDWDDDGRLDLLVGAGDGLVRLYGGLPIVPASLSDTKRVAPGGTAKLDWRGVYKLH